MKLDQVFNRRFGAALLFILGGLLALSPAGMRKSIRISPRDLATAIISKSDKVTAEEIAHWLIDKRPDILLVDIRTTEEYQKYHIPGAINLPLARLFEPESLDQLDQDKTIVLYSNGSVYAAQAWVMLRQLGIESYVLSGGLNYWVQAILNPKPPGDLVADEEILQYQFRKAASRYFAGGAAVATAQQQTSKPKPVVKFKLKKKKKVDEGC